MVQDFKDIYEILGVKKNLEQEKLESKIDSIMAEAYEANKSGQMSEEEYQMLKKSEEILRDKKERKIYDNIGHERYVEKEDIEELKSGFLKDDVYKDFYDLFDLEPDSDMSEIKRQTAIKVKKMHPDKDTEESLTTEGFETLKRARNVLTDSYEKDKYDDMGHNRYVKKEIDGELEEFTFSGRTSLLEGLNEENEDSDVEDLMAFKNTSTTHDPTSDALDRDLGETETPDTISEARKQREIVEKRKEVMNEGDDFNDKNHTRNKQEEVKEEVEKRIEEDMSSYENIMSSLFTGTFGVVGTKKVKIPILIGLAIISIYFGFIFFSFLGAGISIFLILAIYLIFIQD